MLIAISCPTIARMPEQADLQPALRLLIVEDLEDDALLLLQRFRSAGYAVQYQRVDNQLDMKIALQAQSWDAVLSDHRMPSFDAMAALALMQSLDCDLPFIIVSGVIDEETAILAMQAGAHDYLSKDKLDRLVPAVEREIREAVNRAERRSAQQAMQESEARYRTLATNLPGMVFQMRLEADRLLITYASEVACSC
ncbi:MAG: response regulator [Sterolibacteriaceae bacterium]|nr:response regulator [Candidatus Methylophosphatis haderslevensis]